MIIYWFVIFFSYFRRDKELQKERSYQLEREVKNYQTLLHDAKQRKETENGLVKRPQDDVIIQQIPKILEKYKNQQSRTKSANFWSLVVRESDFIIPLILAINALLILLC